MVNAEYELKMLGIQLVRYLNERFINIRAIGGKPEPTFALAYNEHQYCISLSHWRYANVWILYQERAYYRNHYFIDYNDPSMLELMIGKTREWLTYHNYTFSLKESA